MPALELDATWLAADGDGAPSYRLALTNGSQAPLRDFRLCISGPCQIAPGATMEGGAFGRRLSTFTELLPPEGLTLAPGATWTVTLHDIGWSFRHWTDGALGAYLALADGNTLTVSTAATKLRGSNRPPKRGVEPYPVPAAPPEPERIDTTLRGAT